MVIFLTALLGTIGVEYVAFAGLHRRLRATDLAYLTLINALTNPLLIYLHRTVLVDRPWLWGFFLLEFAVFLVETVLIAILFGYPLRRSLAVSFACNATSALVGLYW